MIRLLEENGILKKKTNFEDLDAYEKYTEIKNKEEYKKVEWGYHNYSWFFLIFSL